MKTQILSLLLFFTATSFVLAQAPMASPKKSVSFSFVQSDGTNASAVAWNPGKRVYYAVIAGNAEFPLETFDDQGRMVSARAARADIRGLWWNAKNRSLMGNCAGEGGWVEMATDLEGSPSGEPNIFIAGQNQPDFQSVAAFDGKKVVFYNEGSLFFYNPKNGKPSGSVSLQLPASQDDINATSIGCTGKKGYEYVLLDYEAGKLYFFNRKGKQTATSKLPADAITYSVFRFSFANGMAFLYDAAERTWTGYRVF
jgi:hypothetical protein